MSDDIRTLFVQDDHLHIVRDGQVFRVKGNGGEPNTWPVEHFANVGLNEEFVDYFSGELLRLIDASHIHGSEREAAKEAVLTVLTEGLLPAFETLKRIRASVNQPMPKLNSMQLYEDFTRVLWHAYKDLFQRAAVCLNFQIGFLFKGQKEFEQGIEAFHQRHPTLLAPDLRPFFREQRTEWQNEFCKFRNNHLEHRTVARSKFAKFYDPSYAETLFKTVWGVMANLLPVFIEANFASGFSIELIPESERASTRGDRFRYIPWGVREPLPPIK